MHVGRVDIGLPNRLVIDDLELYDQQGHPMLNASRLSAKADITPLFKGKISISSAQIFGMDAHFYQKDANTPANYQFVLDSLSSKDQKEKTPLDLNIKSLVVRNGKFTYDRLDIPPSNVLSPHHLGISNLSAHLMLNRLTDEEIDIKVKRLSFKEQSGLDLRKLSLHLKADKQSAHLTDLAISLPASILEADTLTATYEMANGTIDKQTFQYHGAIDQLSLTPADITCLYPKASAMSGGINLSARFSGSINVAHLHHLQLSTAEGVRLRANGNIQDLQETPQWIANIEQLSLNAEALQKIAQNASSDLNIPPALLRLGDIAYRGEIGGKGKQYAMRGRLSTDAGIANLTAGIHDLHITGHAETEGLDLGRILADDRLGMLATTIDIDGLLPISKDMSMLAKGTIQRFDFNGNTYSNITVDGFYDKENFNGTLSIDDPHGQIGVEGRFDLSPSHQSAQLSASARHFNPHALGLTDQLKGHEFDFDLTTDVQGFDLNTLTGIIDVENFSLRSPDKNYHLSRLHLDTDNKSADKYVELTSDFGQVHLDGHYQFNTIVASLANIVKSKLPTLPFLPSTSVTTGNDFHFTADIDRSDWLQQLTGIDIEVNSPLHLNGHLDEPNGSIELSLSAPSVEYKGGDYRDIDLHMTTRNDTIYTEGSLKKMQDNGKPFDLALSSSASNNKLSTDIAFNNHGGKQKLRGMISTTADFLLDEENRKAAHVRMNHSRVFVNKTPWEIEPSELQFADKDIYIDDFTIRNGEQHIIISGSLTDQANDSIHLDLKKLDAQFISAILHVKGVDFGGLITGDAYITSVYDTPQAKANLFIDDFKFVGGRIGEMSLQASWNSSDKRIELLGTATDGNVGRTDVNGFVDLSKQALEINILADNTPLKFLHRFCSSFIDDIGIRGNGHVRLSGPLSHINLEGEMACHGPVHISSLNTTYTLLGDTVKLIPNHILFDHANIHDKDGHQGYVTGSVDHNELSNFTFELDVHADNLLCYDFKDFGDDTFCGTVYATGDCHIKGVSGEITIDVDATPEKNTVFYYNAASPDMLNRQDFIQWNDITPEAIDYSGLPSASNNAPLRPTIYEDEEDSQDSDDVPTNLRMTFRINATPDATLRLLMDAESGDYISLNGSGSLRANYFNKGTFTLFGNYVVDQGIYKLTVQNVIKKDFQFQQGGTITFGGNPYDATLQLKALYTINGVSLSDLNIGRSFSSNNIRVNCIMNIGGSPYSPTVDFDLELPTMNSDAQQMVRSLINSEEELNQQVIYLLAIGRFYNPTPTLDGERQAAGQSQTSLAMQSLLSGTISQQINSVLSNVIKSNNWNFGANISTGAEGFNNAEYEGLLSGRLLNNRLLINGQFGYRDNPNATTSFIGDFDIRYLLYPNGNLALKVYNQTNDRYFIKNSLNTQGVGLIMKKDFNGWRELVGWKRRKKNNK